MRKLRVYAVQSHLDHCPWHQHGNHRLLIVNGAQKTALSWLQIRMLIGFTLAFSGLIRCNSSSDGGSRHGVRAGEIEVTWSAAAGKVTVDG